MSSHTGAHDGRVLSLTYTSAATRLLSVGQLVELIEQIRPKNERLGVTGLHAGAAPVRVVRRRVHVHRLFRPAVHAAVDLLVAPMVAAGLARWALLTFGSRASTPPASPAFKPPSASRSVDEFDALSAAF